MIFFRLSSLLLTLPIALDVVRLPHNRNPMGTNPCSILPREPKKAELEEAHHYCRSVLDRFRRHPVSTGIQNTFRRFKIWCSEKKTLSQEIKRGCKIIIMGPGRRPNTWTYKHMDLEDYVTDLTFWIPEGYKMDVDVSKIIVDGNRGGWLAAVETHKKEERTNNVGVYAVKGTGRPQIEDMHKFYENPLDTKTSFFGVFDGHSGTYASWYAGDVMMKALVRNVAAVKKLIGGSTPTRSGTLTKDNQPQKTEQPPPETERKTNLKTEHLRNYLEAGGVINYRRLLTDVILMADEALCEQFLLKPAGVPSSVGSSVLLAVIEGSQLTVANVGDSRGVMCDSDGLPVALSFDHKPSRPDEKRRIEKAGGTVVYSMNAYRLDGYLALSRAIGPHPGKKEKHLIADPEVLTFDLSEYKPQFLVLATDGLYDVLSSADVVAFLLTRLHEPDFGARSLVQLALLMRSTDDITVMVINLKGQKLPKPNRARRIGVFKHWATSFARKHLPSGKQSPSSKKSPSSRKLPPSEKSPSRISVPPSSPPPTEESSKVSKKQ